MDNKQWTMYTSPTVNENFPTILESQNCPQVLTLLTLSEARGGGVSVRSLIISTSETYCKFMSKMSAWLGFPLEEGHSGEKIKLRKIGASRIITHPKRGMENNSHKACVKGVPWAGQESLTRITILLWKSLPVTFLPLDSITKRSRAFQSHIWSKTGSLKRIYHLLSVLWRGIMQF